MFKLLSKSLSLVMMFAMWTPTQTAAAASSEELYQGYALQGQQSLQQGKLDEAERYLVGALTERKKLPPIDYRPATTSSDIGRLKAVISAKELNAKLCQLADSLGQQNKVAEKVRIFEFLLADPGHASPTEQGSIWSRLAEAQAKQGHDSEAERAYSKSAQLYLANKATIRRYDCMGAVMAFSSAAQFYNKRGDAKRAAESKAQMQEFVELGKTRSMN